MRSAGPFPCGPTTVNTGLTPIQLREFAEVRLRANSEVERSRFASRRHVMRLFYGNVPMGVNISLTPQLEEIRQKVDSGLYNSASEVVREALRLMDE
jgi:hypothetical protein